jgi:pimeloyl-ACP methyl ester carboxylesterase
LSAVVVRITVPVNGFEFDALSAGPADGEPVLLLHGFPETSHSWRHQIPVLADAGYRVLAPDQRGYSPRARPAEVDAYRGEHLVSDVLGFAGAMGGGPVHLVGHDWGAAIAWQVAGRHPDALRTLTILSVPHPAAFGSALRGGGDQKDRSSYVQMFRTEGTEDILVADGAQGLRFIYLGSGLSEADAEVYLEALGTADALGAALNWYRAASLTDVEGLGEITTPTLYVWSTEDVALGREAAEATEACVLGPYRFVVLDGVSHWISEHAPDQLNVLLLEHLGG